VKKLLITGGCGFIGSNFIRYFLSRHSEYRVVNLDKLTYCGNRENLKDCEKNPRYQFIHGDICDRTVVFEAVKDVSAIINFAAETHVDRSLENADDFLRTNIVGVKNLLDAVNTYSLERFVQISTDEVYGSIAKGSWTEEFPLLPNSPYAVSKASSDLLCRSYYGTYNTPVIITRCSNNFGPFQYPEKVIPLFITNLLEQKKVPLYSRGEQIREWLYVEDHCRAIELAFEKGKNGEVYNVGGGKELTNFELTKLILHKLGKDERWIQYVPDRPGHDYRYSLDCRKIQKLGFTRTADFDTALDETIQWYKDNVGWWQPLKKDKYTKKEM
jgi:dTDP-glucose 4,6-dehydratase